MGGRHPQPFCRAAVIVACLATLGFGATGAGADVHKGRQPSQLGFDAIPIAKPWVDATAFGAWYSLHDGFGRTQVEPAGKGRVLTLQTRAPATAAETFSSLVRTRRGFRDVDFAVTVQTTAQLRRPANPWEVGWVLWRYTDNSHFYSFIVKPNGWELAKQDGAYNGSQRFLEVSYGHSYPVGRPYRIRVRHIGASVIVWVDGVMVVRYTDRERPYSSGSIALYAEDSAVRYSPVLLHRGG
jgi:hypothetical protein